jgi:hypothetical protein
MGIILCLHHAHYEGYMDILQDREIREEYQNKIKAKISKNETAIVEEWKLLKDTLVKAEICGRT